jgi:hypothetical protein
MYDQKHIMDDTRKQLKVKGSMNITHDMFKNSQSVPT